MCFLWIIIFSFLIKICPYVRTNHYCSLNSPKIYRFPSGDFKCLNYSLDSVKKHINLYARTITCFIHEFVMLLAQIISCTHQYVWIIRHFLIRTKLIALFLFICIKSVSLLMVLVFIGILILSLNSTTTLKFSQNRDILDYTLLFWHYCYLYVDF